MVSATPDPGSACFRPIAIYAIPMSLKFSTEDARLSEEVEREHEIRNLKETVTDVREALEEQKAGTATEVEQAVAEAHGEIRDLKTMVAEMRMQLEKSRADAESALQKLKAQNEEEKRQLQRSIQVLRDQLEVPRAQK